MKTQITPKGDERSMYLQRPSTGKSQDIRHILTQTFRDLYTRDTVRPETVKNLQVSKGGDDPYHERYVESLQKVYEEWQKRMDEAAMLERHIMQAQARATSADERELNHTLTSCDNYTELGLPPGQSNFRSCIDTELLKSYGLITPEDYSLKELDSIPAPQIPKTPSYARQTLTSDKHTLINNTREETPLFIPPAELMADLTDSSFVTEGYDMQDLALFDEYNDSGNWKLQLNTEQRDQDRQDLAMMNAKVNYLRNPRYIPPSAPPGCRLLTKQFKKKPKEICIQEKIEELKPSSPSVIFIASPPVVSFKQYQVGPVYEIQLELKNVSTVLRQCRILPPKTSFFSVGLGQFPGEHGLVAPGMSCKYAVRFIPDSLRDYRDEIVVQTQSSTPLVIPLEGRREPPQLTLPSVWNIGYSLVGGYEIVQLVVRNDGGNGRFCIMPRSSWPAVSFKSAVTKPSVTIGPFEIRPSTLELKKDQTGIIEVIFHPGLAEVYNEDITLVCDNCNVQHYSLKGEGQLATVSLEYVDSGLKERLPGEIGDVSAQHIIEFEELNPYTYVEKTVKVQNKSNVELPFQWLFYKPLFANSTNEDDSITVTDTRVLDSDSPFSIRPSSGSLLPQEEAEFKLIFSPPLIGEYQNVLHMLLNQLPPGSASSQQSLPEHSTNSNTSIDEEKASDTSSTHKDAAKFKDVIAMEIEMKGKSVPLNVMLHPYAIYIPGKTLVGNSVKKTFTMANHSYSTITFQFEPHIEGHIVEVEPPCGDLDPGMAIDLEISITGVKPGKLNHTIYCQVHNMDQPMPLHVQAEFKGPEISVEEPDVNFGLIRLGESSVREITLNNLSQMPTKWKIRDFVTSPASSEDSMNSEEVEFYPSHGELKPLERSKVTITFKPTQISTVHRVFEVEVEDGHICSVAGYGEVQSPAVCFIQSEIKPQDVYVGVPVLCQAVLHNKTSMSTQFDWLKPMGADSENCSIEIEPISGTMAPKEERIITISFVASQVGEVKDLKIPCSIEGMDEPLCLSLSCEVLGLSVTCKTSDSQRNISEELKVDFGNEVQLGTTPRMYLYICNQTAIPASYSITVENFPVKPPSPPQQNKLDSSGTSLRKALLGRTPVVPDPMSKSGIRAQADIAKIALSSGLGAGFSLSPASGNLSPYGEDVIEITAYSDIWGTYTDTITCRMGDLEPITVPLSMTVVGCPLNFQMTAAIPNQKPVVRFGTHVSGLKSVKRAMRINNTSPFDIRLDWRIFNQVKDDDQTLDLTVCYGRCFPPTDEDGREIIHSTEEMPQLERGTTNFIPNSPDTTPGTSRQVTDCSQDQVNTEPYRPKIISLFLNPHEGQCSTKPYSILPSQVVVPGNGHAQVSAIFTPLPSSDVTEEIDCLGYALGYMSLDGKAAGIEGCCYRKEAYESSLLRLDMTAQLKPALLTIENTDEEGMRYRSVMSDLIVNGETQAEAIKESSTVLSNHTGTPLNFRLLVNKPFLLVDIDPSSNIDGATRATETLYNTLEPQHSLIVKVGFQTTCELLSHDSLKDMESLDSSRKLEIEDNLVIEFNNMAKQKVPLHATLTVPQIQLSKQSLDFGTCLVDQPRVMELFISNQTSSQSLWKVSVESVSDSCISDTFKVEPSQGILDAYITHVSNSKSLLTVTFLAKHEEHYEAVFLFRGTLGENPQRLYVRGEGSYDGKHESLLNP